MYQAETDLSDNTLRNWLVSMFPATMNQEDESNNQNLLNLIADLLNGHKNDLLSISDQVLLNNASGQTLTDIALDYGINRLDDDDDFLRFQVRLQLLENHMGITTNDLKTLIATVLNIGTDVFDINGTDNPEEVEVTNIPFDFNSGDKAEVKRKILTNAIQSMLPPEYLLNDLQYATTVNNQLYVGVHAQSYPQITVEEMV
ncbi:hypothetical protein [Lentilactobacillus parabuchneri]|uniref:hypothetical protein n=1 Tax=Lentilactobacillus parabuchneri TaxID=152331 RepID=UPI000A11455A|nr:hypothetical protein [Lentilactobacillus parabuchneri]ORN12743.1 hypothetical protein FAM23164_02371 [Lentilactobacillus parabuchneri]ORN14633.1 hypothetical protein FAM23165_02379 [Lentilactobacillus parabuchneri]ORN17545.1 hypothetical protein FAM23166_02356 [Lentilactobacillus parabuchneri]ORN23927.1 hypothetical protein FAM23167_02141 [Lentilactobacillus parabuchneri]